MTLIQGAFHEAGHAIVALVAGARVSEAVVEENIFGEVKGHVMAQLDDWHRPEHEVAIMAAGAEATLKFYKSAISTHTGRDRRRVLERLPDCRRGFSPFLTAEIILAHPKLVRELLAIAHRLCEKRRLNGDEIKRLAPTAFEFGQFGRLDCLFR